MSTAATNLLAGARRLLLVEDNPGDALLIREMLVGPGDDRLAITHVETMEQARAALREASWDALLLDLRLPDCEGMACVGEIRAIADDVAIVVLTGFDNLDLALECLAAGAQDYIGKQTMYSDGLRRAVSYAVTRMREASAVRRADTLQARLAAIVESSDDAILSFAPDGTIESWNRGAETIFGYRADEAIGQRITDFLRSDEHGDSLRHALREMARTGRYGRPREMQRIRKDGTPVIVSAVAFPIGENRVGAIIRDVTEVRTMQAREAEIEDKLRQAQKFEALGTLAGGIAHDLNNTLLPIVAIGSMLAEYAHDDRERQAVGLVLAAAERAKLLVSEILAFSRNGPRGRELVRLDTLVKDTMRTVRKLVPDPVRCELKVEPVPPISANPGQLYQVILNLVTNAAQAIAPSSGMVTICVSADRYRVRLSVEDNGRGMDELTRSRIFDPFFTTRSASEGTGLGLSVVKGVVADHGADIQVRSAIGEGSRFEIHFPAVFPRSMDVEHAVLDTRG